MRKRSTKWLDSTPGTKKSNAAAVREVQLLIVDANVLLDIKAGDLIQPMFSLDYEFGVPDILFEEELVGWDHDLPEIGLQIYSLSGESMQRVIKLKAVYPPVSSNDRSALVLAEVKQCPLLTGDADLRKAAEQENIKVNGTLWLIRKMLEEQHISLLEARMAMNKMREAQRWLPWGEMEKMFSEFESAADRLA